MKNKSSCPEVFDKMCVLKNFAKFMGKRQGQRLLFDNFFFFFSIWVFFHEHSQFIGQQEKGEAISLSPLYHFHPLHRHLGISQAITAEPTSAHR